MPPAVPGLLILVVIVAALIAAARRRGTGPRTLVLRGFSANAETGEVRFAGRPRGLISPILTSLGPESQTSLVADAHQIHYQTRSPFGQTTISIGFETAGGMMFGPRSRRSVIENVPVDIEQARYAVQIISRSILLSSSTRQT